MASSFGHMYFPVPPPIYKAELLKTTRTLKPPKGAITLTQKFLAYPIIIVGKIQFYPILPPPDRYPPRPRSFFHYHPILFCQS